MAWDMNNVFNPQMNQPYPTNNYFNRNEIGTGVRLSIIRVTGEQGARSMRMAPNSEVLALDTTAPIVWLLQTDGAGYLNATPYDISAHQSPTVPDVNSLEQRVAKLEEMLNGKQSDSKQNE